MMADGDESGDGVDPTEQRVGEIAAGVNVSERPVEVTIRRLGLIDAGVHAIVDPRAD
jgi:hypothetical protein